jgi:hypothetical protein
VNILGDVVIWVLIANALRATDTNKARLACVREHKSVAKSHRSKHLDFLGHYA